MTDDTTASHPEPDLLGAVVDERLGRFVPRFHGLAVGLRVGEQQVTRGFGRTRSAGPTPDERTSFQIGSVTKLFTTLLLADAVVRGEVTLDQDVDTLLPGTRAYPRRRPITLVDLATHSAGLPRLPPGLRRQALRHRLDPYGSFTTDQLVRALGRKPKRPPGERVRYSNFGAAVLGEALVRATGRSYEDLVTTRIVGPLGLRDTRVHVDLEAPDVAVGHSRRGRRLHEWRMPSMPGAGALRSSVRDLLTFLAAHLEPERTPLGDAIDLTLEPRVRMNRHLRVGLGWHVLDRRNGPPWWWHNGGTAGFFAFVGMDRESRTASVVLTNGARPVDPLGAALLEPLPVPRSREA